jgi:urea carboxylase
LPLNEDDGFTHTVRSTGRFFDQVKFFPVTPEELTRIRAGMVDGTERVEIADTTFSLKNYRAFLAANADEINTAKARQQAAFDAERARWQAADQMAVAIEADQAPNMAEDIPPGSTAVESTVPGCVWKVVVIEGARVSAGDPLVIVESMKMEMSITAPSDGIVTDIRCAEGKPVSLGQTLLLMTVVNAEAAQ